MLQPPNLGTRYTLKDLLGQGAVGTVYRAWDHQTVDWCAVKLLRAGLLRSRGLRERFRREARVLEQLHHPHVVRVHEFCDEPSQAWLAMEWVPGGSLQGWMTHHGVLAPRAATVLCIQAAEALEHAHSLGIVHRDVKPANLLISRDGGIRIADFGLARLAEVDIQLTRTNTRMGSIGFMAPEQQVSARDVDHRADVFSLGATLCFLLTGQIPHHVEPVLDALHATAPGLAYVVMRATLQRQEHRWPSAGHMATALARALGELPTDPAGVPPLFMPPTVQEAPPLSGPTIVVDED